MDYIAIFYGFCIACSKGAVRKERVVATCCCFCESGSGNQACLLNIHEMKSVHSSKPVSHSYYLFHILIHE